MRISKQERIWRLVAALTAPSDGIPAPRKVANCWGKETSVVGRNAGPVFEVVGPPAAFAGIFDGQAYWPVRLVGSAIPSDHLWRVIVGLVFGAEPMRDHRGSALRRRVALTTYPGRAVRCLRRAVIGQPPSRRRQSDRRIGQNSPRALRLEELNVSNRCTVHARQQLSVK